MIVIGSNRLHLRDRDCLDGSAGKLVDQSCSEPSERTFLRDYSGKDLAEIEGSESDPKTKGLA